MSYQVLARKWRPRSFDQVVGQTAALKALTYALEQQRLHHAYLFTGTRGVGKTTVARILAKCLNCEQGISAKPCEQCNACREIDAGCFPDFIEVDAASRSKVEETRELLDNVVYAPVRGRYKIYLIDEVHMLSGHSFNALLKTLEEPPAHVKFFLATTDPDRLPATIISRCLQFLLTPLTPELIAAHLSSIVSQENATAEPAALLTLAQAAAGSMRDALSLLDQLLAYSRGQLTHSDVRAVLGIPFPEQIYALLHSLAKKNGKQLLQQLAELGDRVPDLTTVLTAIIESLQGIALAQLVPDSLVPTHPHYEAISSLAQHWQPKEVQLFYDIAIKGRQDLPFAATVRGGLEMTLLRMLATCSEKAEQKPTKLPEKTIEVPQETVKPVVTAPAVSALELQEDNWNTIVGKLSLTGMTKAFAQHCVIIYADEQAIKLAIAPEHAALVNRQQQQRLEEALANYYGKPRKLQILIQDLPSITPAAQQKEAHDKQQQHAKSAFMADPHVQMLVNTLGATVTTTTVPVGSGN